MYSGCTPEGNPDDLGGGGGDGAKLHGGARGQLVLLGHLFRINLFMISLFL